MPSYLVLEFLYISGFYKFGPNDIETLRLRFLSIALCCSFFFIPLSKLQLFNHLHPYLWSYVKQKVLQTLKKNRFRSKFFLTTVRKNVTLKNSSIHAQGYDLRGSGVYGFHRVFSSETTFSSSAQVWSNLLILHFDCVYNNPCYFLPIIVRL